jgi:hypothetical protein
MVKKGREHRQKQAVQIVADREHPHEGSNEQNQETLSWDQETLFILGPVNIYLRTKAAL